jgi:hypothetical protein
MSTVKPNPNDLADYARIRDLLHERWVNRRHNTVTEPSYADVVASLLHELQDYEHDTQKNAESHSKHMEMLRGLGWHGVGSFEDWARAQLRVVTDNPLAMIAARAASLLMQWAQFDGDPPDDAEQLMTAHIKTVLDARPWAFVLDTDDGPGRELQELATACEFEVSWPAKHYLKVDPKGSASERRGSGGSYWVYTLVPECKVWLVTPYFSVDPHTRVGVVDAIRAGVLNGAYIEPFTPHTLTE